MSPEGPGQKNGGGPGEKVPGGSKDFVLWNHLLLINPSTAFLETNSMSKILSNFKFRADFSV